MKGLPEERAIALGEYIAEHSATVRQAAKAFDVSKSTVHKDVSERLAVISPTLYNDVKAILDKNKLERHIRGGIATKNKYQKLKKN